MTAHAMAVYLIFPSVIASLADVLMGWVPSDVDGLG